MSLLACPVGRRRNVGDVTGGPERANGRAASEAGVGRVGELPASETLYWGLGRDGDDAAGWPVPVPSAGSWARRRCSETPCVRPRMKWSDGLVRSRGLLKAQQGRVSPWVSLVDFSLRRGTLMFVVHLVWEVGWIFILIWVPLIMVPDTDLVC
jgi:hypothetical protein